MRDCPRVAALAEECQALAKEVPGRGIVTADIGDQTQAPQRHRN